MSNVIPDAGLSKWKNRGQTNFLYKLRCIVLHEGFDYTEGHYTTVFYNGDGYVLLDDNNVKYGQYQELI